MLAFAALRAKSNVTDKLLASPAPDIMQNASFVHRSRLKGDGKLPRTRQWKNDLSTMRHCSERKASTPIPSEPLLKSRAITKLRQTSLRRRLKVTGSCRMNQQFSNPYCDKGRMVRSSWTSKYFPFELKTVINVAKAPCGRG